MSLSPPPRKPSVSSPQRSSSTRYPKINTNALFVAHAPINEIDDQDVEKDLANFFASTSLSAPTSSSLTSPTPLPDRKYYSRPSSIATAFSPIDPSDASWSSRTSPQPCPLGHHHHLHHYDVDSTLHGGHDQDMAMAGPMLPSCSYCSSIRSNSISSIMEETHSSQVRERNNSTSLSYENQRRDALRELVPNVVRQRLTFHLDECWFVHFSPSAQYLASAGLDFSVILWQDVMTPEPSIYRTFNFNRSISHISWSPDSKYLAVNFQYDPSHKDFICELMVVEVESGETLFSRSLQDKTCQSIVSDIAWFPDSQRILYTDDSGKFCVWNLKGDLIQEYTVGKAHAGKFLRNIPETDNFVVLTVGLVVDIHSFGETGHTIRSLGAQSQHATTVNVSQQGRYAVVTVKDDMQMHRPAQMVVYDLNAMTYLRSFEAETLVNTDFIIMPTFIGPHEELLCAGSETGKLHLWDVETGDLISVLDEHSKHSGCMASSLVYPGLMASCSDDNHIIIWVTKDLQRELQESDEKWLEKRRQLARPAFDIKKGW